MNFLGRLKERLGGGNETTFATLDEKFSGIEPIKAEKSTYEIWENGLKLTFEERLKLGWFYSQSTERKNKSSLWLLKKLNPKSLSSLRL